MSPLERPVPPTGEEIHIPGPSAQPLLLTLGITISLLGITLGPLLLIPGLVLTVVVLLAWIRDARREYEHLPLEHHVEVHDTAPSQAERPAEHH
jgi:hypothetical protein